ncbi:RusA family crossover junction endodeoxyribonuclease [Thalassovita mediterranea]|nr:RusA family crossover junction endodeoxyribonuclease [Thalassovita mediterranea]
MEPEFPFEFFLPGVPVSAQAKNKANLRAWQARVEAAAIAKLQPQTFVTFEPLEFELLFFVETDLASDLDNATKPILDALRGVIYSDDRQIFDLHVAKHIEGGVDVFSSPSETLLAALKAKRPIVYVSIDVVN